MHEAEALICFDAYRQLIRYGLSEVPNRFKDFVTRPKPNGYQSLHTNLRLPDGRVFEVQVRTRRMHEAAEFGSAAHNAYRAAQLEERVDSDVVARKGGGVRGGGGRHGGGGDRGAAAGVSSGRWTCRRRQSMFKSME